MKRIIAIFIALVMVLSTSVVPAMAAEEQTTQTIAYLEDGSYIVTVIEETVTHGARSSTKVGSKSRSYYDSNNVLQWKMTVTGEFMYDGMTSSCTYASGVTRIYNTGRWSVTSESSTAGSSTAYYNVTFSILFSGVVTERPTYSVDLSCDKDGNLF